MKVLIKNGLVIDPETKTEKITDVLIEDDTVKKISEKIKEDADRVIDAKGCYVMPGFIDLHVHLREPGFEYKGNVETESRAAAHGGYTTICAMPNTKPVIDNKDRVDFIHNKAKAVSPINVLQIGAISKKQAGEELADIADMVEAGSPAISEDGKSVMNLDLYVKAMNIAKELNIPVMAHCEDKTLAKDGAINAGVKAEELHVHGITNSVEDVIVIRDILLAKETGVHLHLCHCSTAESVEEVRIAKEKGIKVSAEVCPHHFVLSEDDIPGDDANYKMNPPLRSKADVEALRKGLADDIMDVIATDHAPHHEDEKKLSIAKAPFGIIGLETAAALTYTYLVEGGFITKMQMAEKMSYNPARIINIDKGTITEGKTADIVIFDPEAEYTIKAEDFMSKAKNSPFIGMKVKGKVKNTICGGKIVYDDSKNRK